MQSLRSHACLHMLLAHICPNPFSNPDAPDCVFDLIMRNQTPTSIGLIPKTDQGVDLQGGTLGNGHGGPGAGRVG